MDEPTAALAIKEVGKVLDLIKTLKEHGVAVIIISHRMDDIFYACDRVMALYQGTNFAEAPLDKTHRNEVIGWIMGTKGHTDSTGARQGATEYDQQQSQDSPASSNTTALSSSSW